jgi:hypothetical protein
MTRRMATKALCVGLLAASFAFAQACAADGNLQAGASELSSSQKAVSPAAPTGRQSLVSQDPKRADFLGEPVSQNAQRLADWVADSGDNHGLPFVIVDKVDAKVFVFDKEGQLGGATPALVGLTRGDDTVPGISGRKLSSIRPNERITPAGRFVAALDYNSGGQRILWVDYDAGIALHPVVTTNPKENRLQRLATPTPLDNRISYGCINVSAKFFQSVVMPAFTGTDGVVYISPEVHSIHEVFPTYYEVAPHSPSQILDSHTPAL